MTIHFEGAKQTRFRRFFLLRSCSYSYLYPQFKYDSFRTFQSMSFPPSGILRTYNGFSSVGLICLIDRVSRPAIANVRLRFPVKPEFFKVLFQLQFWCYTDSFFNRLGLFILQRRLCSLFFSLSAVQNMIHFIYFNSSFRKLNQSAIKIFPFVME